MMEPFVSPPMISCSVRKAGCLRERETVLQAALILAKLPWGAQLSCHRRHYRPTAFTFLRAASGDGRLPVPLLSILVSSFAGIFLYRAATVPAHPQYNNGHVTVIFPTVAPNTPPFCTWFVTGQLSSTCTIPWIDTDNKDNSQYKKSMESATEIRRSGYCMLGR